MPPPGARKTAREHEFAYELELARREAGLTVAQVASALYCVPRTVRRYLAAERRPPRDLVVKWEMTCGTRPGRLTERYDSLDVPDARAGRSIGATARARTPRIVFNLPPVVASFAGREDLLATLDGALRCAEQAVITQAIIGLGGVGKTQLLAHYVQTRSDRYDVVAWIRAEDGGIADLAALAERIGVPVDGLSPTDRAQAALARLAATDGRQLWMLVLDNVQSPAHLAKLVPRAGVGHVLVTSRDRALRQLAPVLVVDVFDEDTATRYLTERSGRRDDAPGARGLARALGCLPLALSHAAAYCDSGTSFAAYLELLEGLPARALFDSHPEVSYATTVASTWKASIAAATSCAVLAGEVLTMAAWLGPDEIPKTLFGGLTESGEAAGRKLLADAFNAVARFSLASVYDETLSVHRLLQKTIREEAARDVAPRRALDALRDAFPEDASTPAGWVRAERLLPHCVALAGHLSARGTVTAQLVELVNRASWYLNNAEPGSRRSVAITNENARTAEIFLEADDPARLMARNHLATALQWAGQLVEAIAIFESVLEDRARVLGGEHEHTLISSSNLAFAYEDAGRSEPAIEIYERLLPAQERILGVDDPQCSFTRHNLAVSYKAAGRISDAIALLEPLLAKRMAALGEENPETLKSRHHLAASYRAVGRPEDGIAVLEPLLSLRERIIGAEHPHTLMTRHELGCAYADAGRLNDATAVLDDLAEACERMLGSQHPDTLAVRHSLGVAFAREGNTDAAAEMLAAVLADRQRILGAPHRDTRATGDALAATARGVRTISRADRGQQ